MTKRRVVVTGLGCISPVGNTVQTAWSNLLAGKSGIDTISNPLAGIPVPMAGRLTGQLLADQGVGHLAKRRRERQKDAEHAFFYTKSAV